MIIPIWKKVGESTHLLAKKTGELASKKTNDKDDAKATHTGTLDPMAEGLVIVLTNNDRFDKEKYSDWKKTYQFEILFGIETDSLDLLGLQKNIDAMTLKNLKNLEEISQKLDTIIPNLVGKQRQQQPKFSAQRINGKSGFDLAKQQQAFEIKVNNIEIFSLKILDGYSIEIPNLKKIITNKVSLIEGDFRQNEILENWKETFSQSQNNKVLTFPIIKLEAVVSKRTYIRSLVRDISKLINLPATTFSIVRTAEGPYSKINCEA